MKKYFPICSLIFGIISLLVSSLFFYPITDLFSFLFSVPIILIHGIFDKYYPFLQYLFISFSFIGLTLGIISLKLKLGKKKAILGIIFSSIALIIWLFIWFWITGWSVGG